MKELKEAWFEFRGVRSDAMGVELLSRPQRTQPAANGRSVAVSGRSGRLWIDDGAWDNASVQVQCIAPEGDMEGILAWLEGSGELRFSDEPDRVYRARVPGGMVRTLPFARLSAQQFAVEFDCEPFRYLYPAAEEIVLTEAGAAENPGTAPSQPKIVIAGSGDISLTVGNCRMVFEGLEDGIAVDSEIMECLDLEGVQLMNGYADMEEFPVLQPGSNAVAWTGEVQKVTITPRWRWL